MINLLPPTVKKEIRAARVNVVVVRYCVLLLLGIAFLGAIFAVGFYITAQDKTHAEQAKEGFQAQIAQYANTKLQADTFNADLKSAKSILTSETVLSKLITDIAGVLPSGVILASLNLTTSSLGTPLSLSARTANYQTAVDLKTNLEKSPIFEQVSIQNITQNTAAGDSPSFIEKRYPVTVTINATLTKKAGGL